MQYVWQRSSIGQSIWYSQRALPDCGSHDEEDETKDVEVVENSKPKEDVKSELNLTLTT